MPIADCVEAIAALFDSGFSLKSDEAVVDQVLDGCFHQRHFHFDFVGELGGVSKAVDVGQDLVGEGRVRTFFLLELD